MTTAPSARVLWLAAGTLLAVIFTVCAGISLAGNTVGSVTRNQHYVVPEKVSQVTVDGVNADVTVVPASGSQVVVDTRAKGSLWVPKLRTEMDGGHLRLRGSCREMVIGSCESKFTVRVPAGMPVFVTTRSGDVRASDLSGPLKVRAGSGDVELSGLSGGTDAKVASGDIEATRLAGRLRLATTSGDVDAAELTGGTIDARAISGDVFLDVATVPRRINAAATSGDVTVAVPRNGSEGYAAETATSSGDARRLVDVDDDSSRTVNAVTLSGDVTIRYR